MTGAKILSGSEYSQQLLYFDTQKEPFNKKEVRQALDLAIDRAELVDIVYLGAATAGNPGYIHVNHPMANKDLVAAFDPEKAKELLEAAGLKDSDGDGIREWNGKPTNFELLTPAGNAMRQRLAELVADMLKQVGFGVSVAAVESTTWENQIWPEFDVTKGRNYEMGIWGWSASADPAVLAFYAHSDPAIGSYNLTGYVNPEADTLAAEIIKTTDLAQLEEKVKAFQAMFAEDLPFITLLYPDGNYGFWADVYDHFVFVTGQGPMSKLSFLAAE
jgi:peptide/nickel transport system substrate-binding protein